MEDFLSDGAIERLRRAAEHPDLSQTRYDVLEEVARGGMGTVYLAHDRELERKVALKVLNLTELSEGARARMIREARILARLEHPGIVPVHDVGTLEDGRVFYTMKLVEGERLDHHVRKARTLRERLRIFERMCEAVAFAHARGVIHRDLKPSNIMVGSFGEVLVMDWGVAKILDAARGGDEEAAPPSPTTRAAPDTEDTLPHPGEVGPPDETRPGTVLGTPGYMSPEQAAGRAERVDGRTDVYALGIILRELVHEVAAPVPRRLDAVIQKAVKEDRGERYDSVDALSADVSRFLNGDPVSAYREGILDVLGRWYERYRGPIILILTYLVIRLLILLVAGT